MRQLHKIAFIFLVCSCSNKEEQENKNIQRDVFPERGQKIVAENCSGCHSYKDGSTLSRITLFDLYSQGDTLKKSLLRAINDSAHLHRVPKDVTIKDVDQIIAYIKYKNEPVF